MFNLSNQRCQNDVVESKCETGNNFYNSTIQFCNGNEVFNKCNGYNYTPTNQKCENNVVVTKCGTGWYNPANQRCENNVIETICGTSYPYTWYDSSNVNMRCENNVFENKCGMGNNFYNPATQFCYENEIYDKCASSYNPVDYNPVTQFCHKYEHGTYSIVNKCNGQVYDYNKSQRCENNVVITWCETSYPYTWYDSTDVNLRCENYVVETKCGTGWYNARNSGMRCQDNVVETQCENGYNWYNSLTQFCNVNEVLNKCGGNIYDPYTQECADGSVRAATYSGTLTDSRDSKTYEWVRIGSQKWLAENLNYRGTEPNTVGKCYNNLEGNCDTYGRLYDWATAMALPISCNSVSCSEQIGTKHKGICPTGWHLPSREEWNTLTNYVVNNACNSCAGKYLKAASGWNDCGPSGSGSQYLCEDTYGFSALPSGIGYSDGRFLDVGSYGYWRNASENIMDLSMGYRYEYMNNYYDKSNLYSVRCVED
jgi:uncharacterized protein (TIGR02145 family)